MSFTEQIEDEGPAWSEWRDPLRMTLAALLSYLLAQALHLPEGFWAVFTTLIVTRADTGATFYAGAGRLIGTLSGAALATIVGLTRIWHVPQFAVLAAALLPLGFLVAWRSEYRTAPIAAMIVLSAGPLGPSPLAAAALRIAEITLGAATGLLVSAFVFPVSAKSRTGELAAKIVGRVGKAIGAAHAGDAARVAALQERNRADLRALVMTGGAPPWRRKEPERVTPAKLVARFNADGFFLARALQTARTQHNPILDDGAFLTAASAFTEACRAYGSRNATRGDLSALVDRIADIPAGTEAQREVAHAIRYAFRELFRALWLLGRYAA